ncbi:MAG: hypothetical protein RML72_09545, partial [Bacteroidia bacterium]|nr:hypothetical protein [Bacteroidia bacterium]
MAVGLFAPSRMWAQLTVFPISKPSLQQPGVVAPNTGKGCGGTPTITFSAMVANPNHKVRVYSNAAPINEAKAGAVSFNLGKALSPSDYSSAPNSSPPPPNVGFYENVMGTPNFMFFGRAHNQSPGNATTQSRLNFTGTSLLLSAQPSGGMNAKVNKAAWQYDGWGLGSAEAVYIRFSIKFNPNTDGGNFYFVLGNYNWGNSELLDFYSDELSLSADEDMAAMQFIVPPGGGTVAASFTDQSTWIGFPSGITLTTGQVYEFEIYAWGGNGASATGDYLLFKRDGNQYELNNIGGQGQWVAFMRPSGGQWQQLFTPRYMHQTAWQNIKAFGFAGSQATIGVAAPQIQVSGLQARFTTANNFGNIYDDIYPEPVSFTNITNNQIGESTTVGNGNITLQNLTNTTLYFSSFDPIWKVEGDRQPVPVTILPTPLAVPGIPQPVGRCGGPGLVTFTLTMPAGSGNVLRLSKYYSPSNPATDFYTFVTGTPSNHEEYTTNPLFPNPGDLVEVTVYANSTIADGVSTGVLATTAYVDAPNTTILPGCFAITGSANRIGNLAANAGSIVVSSSNLPTPSLNAATSILTRCGAGNLTFITNNGGAVAISDFDATGSATGQYRLQLFSTPLGGLPIATEAGNFNDNGNRNLNRTLVANIAANGTYYLGFAQTQYPYFYCESSRLAVNAIVNASLSLSTITSNSPVCGSIGTAPNYLGLSGNISATGFSLPTSLNFEVDEDVNFGSALGIATSGALSFGSHTYQVAGSNYNVYIAANPAPLSLNTNGTTTIYLRATATQYPGCISNFVSTTVTYFQNPTSITNPTNVNFCGAVSPGSPINVNGNYSNAAPTLIEFSKDINFTNTAPGNGVISVIPTINSATNYTASITGNIGNGVGQLNLVNGANTVYVRAIANGCTSNVASFTITYQSATTSISVTSVTPSCGTTGTFQVVGTFTGTAPTSIQLSNNSLFPGTINNGTLTVTVPGVPNTMTISGNNFILIIDNSSIGAGINQLNLANGSNTIYLRGVYNIICYTAVASTSISRLANPPSALAITSSPINFCGAISGSSPIPVSGTFSGTNPTIIELSTDPNFNNVLPGTGVVALIPNIPSSGNFNVNITGNIGNGSGQLNLVAGSNTVYARAIASNCTSNVANFIINYQPATTSISITSVTPSCGTTGTFQITGTFTGTAPTSIQLSNNSLFPGTINNGTLTVPGGPNTMTISGNNFILNISNTGLAIGTAANRLNIVDGANTVHLRGVYNTNCYTAVTSSTINRLASPTNLSSIAPSIINFCGTVSAGSPINIGGTYSGADPATVEFSKDVNFTNTAPGNGVISVVPTSVGGGNFTASITANIGNGIGQLNLVAGSNTVYVRTIKNGCISNTQNFTINYQPATTSLSITSVTPSCGTTGTFQITGTFTGTAPTAIELSNNPSFPGTSNNGTLQVPSMGNTLTISGTNFILDIDNGSNGIGTANNRLNLVDGANTVYLRGIYNGTACTTATINTTIHRLAAPTVLNNPANIFYCGTISASSPLNFSGTYANTAPSQILLSKDPNFSNNLPGTGVISVIPNITSPGNYTASITGSIGNGIGQLNLLPGTNTVYLRAVAGSCTTAVPST